MGFLKKDYVRYAEAVIDTKDDKILVEQNHKDEVDINNIIRKHGIDMIQKTANIVQMRFDDNPNNDFQEYMNLIIKGQQSFDSLPSEIRKRFGNDATMYMDFVRNPDNKPEGIKLGIFEKEPTPPPPPDPIEVVVVPGTETPV